MTALPHTFCVTLAMCDLGQGLSRQPWLQMTCMVLNISSDVVRIKNKSQGFPGGSVVKNLPANEGDMGSIPGLERALMLWSN